MAEKEPRTGSHFKLVLGGHEQVGVFRECTGMNSESEITEHKCTDANGHPIVRKIAGAAKWGNIELTRGVDTNAKLWEWRHTVVKEGPDKARVDGTVQLVNYDGSAIATYKFLQGWPSLYAGASLNAASNDVAVEKITITHEGLERVG